MFQRIAYGALAIAVLIALVVSDTVVAELAQEWDHPIGRLLERGSTLPLVIAILMCWGAIELNRMLTLSGAEPFRKYSMACVAALMLAPWLSAAGWLGNDVDGLSSLVYLLVGAGIGTAVLATTRGRTDGALRDSSATMLTVLVLGLFGSFALQIRCCHDMLGQSGCWLLLVTVLVIKCSDIGAYFAGSFFGRHKLVPSVSPGKTVEGALGGLMASAAASMIFASLAAAGGASQSDTSGPSQWLNVASDALRVFNFDHSTDGWPPLARACLFGLAMSAAGQLGDLFESCFKRDAGIKDSGNIMPRFGGILDLVDSPVLALPVAWFLLADLWHVI